MQKQMHLQRVLVGIGLTLLFISTAQIFSPDWTRAETPSAESGRVDEDLPSAEAELARGLPSLGAIETVRHRIEIHAGPVEPLYTVIAKENDRVVASHVTLEKIMTWFPELQLDRLDFRAVNDREQLMLADDAPQWPN